MNKSNDQGKINLLNSIEDLKGFISEESYNRVKLDISKRMITPPSDRVRGWNLKKEFR